MEQFQKMISECRPVTAAAASDPIVDLVMKDMTEAKNRKDEAVKQPKKRGPKPKAAKKSEEVTDKENTYTNQPPRY